MIYFIYLFEYNMNVEDFPEYLYNLGIKHDYKGFTVKEIFYWDKLNNDLKSYIFNFFSNDSKIRLVNKEFYTLFYKNKNVLLKACVLHRNYKNLFEILYNLITPKMAKELENPILYRSLKWERNIWDEYSLIEILICERNICKSKCICSRPEEINEIQVGSLIRFVKLYNIDTPSLNKIVKSLLYNDKTLNFISEIKLNPKQIFKLALDLFEDGIAFSICKKYSIRDLNEEEIYNLLISDKNGINTIEIMNIYKINKIKTLKKIFSGYNINQNVTKNIICSIDHFDYETLSEIVISSEYHHINIFLMNIDHESLNNFYFEYAKGNLEVSEKAYAMCKGLIPFEFKHLKHFLISEEQFGENITLYILNNSNEEELRICIDKLTNEHYLKIALEIMKRKYFETYRKETINIIQIFLKNNLYRIYNHVKNDSVFQLIKTFDFDFDFDEKKNILDKLVSLSFYHKSLHELTEETFYYIYKEVRKSYSLNEYHSDLLLFYAIQKEDKEVLDIFFREFKLKKKEEELIQKINLSRNK
jgi:hypothetical protein